MTGAGRFGAGLLIGLATASFVGLLLQSEESSPSTTTATTTTATVPETEPWFEPGEVMIGATAVLPRQLTTDDGVVFFDYDLTGLGPFYGGDSDEDASESGSPQGAPLAMPERWVLRTESGVEVEATTGLFDSSVRFELPDAEDEVASITLVGWRVGVPFGRRVELPIQEGATGEFRRGTVTIETVLEQRTSTIVQLDYEDDGDPWGVDVVFLPTDAHWRVSGTQLTWDGDDAPSSIVLEDSGLEMRPVVGEILVVDQGSDL